VPAEEEYLLEGFNHYFSPSLRRDDIRGRFAGLRPLLRSAPDDPSARSREYKLIDGPQGLLSIAGGKWTTYRHMAEVVADRIAERLGPRKRCQTRAMLLDGAPTEAWSFFAEREANDISAAFGWNMAIARHLVNRYGTHARQVAEVVREQVACQPVVAGEIDMLGEWEYQRREEMAVTRADHLLRRSRIGLWHPELLDGYSC
jgi:glycerol-3-phosphate dehydrogenase